MSELSELEDRVNLIEGEARHVKATLRDQFAMAALQGLIHMLDSEDPYNIDDMAVNSYRFADAMLEASKEG